LNHRWLEQEKNMARFYPALTEQHQLFIAGQNIFFTASAPQHGRINLSPKGMDSLGWGLLQ